MSQCPDVLQLDIYRKKQDQTKTVMTSAKADPHHQRARAASKTVRAAANQLPGASRRYIVQP